MTSQMFVLWGRRDYSNIGNSNALVKQNFTSVYPLTSELVSHYNFIPFRSLAILKLVFQIYFQKILK